MNNLKDVVYANKLLDTYGELLTESQYKMMELYFRFDLSLSEIADERNVSKAAVNDSIHKSLKLLHNYEEVLHNIKRKEAVSNIIDEIETEKDEDKRKQLIEKLKKEYLS